MYHLTDYGAFQFEAKWYIFVSKSPQIPRFWLKEKQTQLAGDALSVDAWDPWRMSLRDWGRGGMNIQLPRLFIFIASLEYTKLHFWVCKSVCGNPRQSWLTASPEKFIWECKLFIQLNVVQMVCLCTFISVYRLWFYLKHSQKRTSDGVTLFFFPSPSLQLMTQVMWNSALEYLSSNLD